MICPHCNSPSSDDAAIFCGRCGKPFSSRQPSESANGNTPEGATGNWTKTALFVLVGLVVCAGLAWFGYGAYRNSLLKQRLEEAIGKDQGLTETILKVETESAHMTYGEFFDLCGKSVDSRTNLIVDLRGLYPNINSSLKERLIEYLSAENDFVRAKSALYRSSMEVNSALETYQKAALAFAVARYSWEFELRQKSESRQALTKAANEADSAAGEFVRLYTDMAKREAGMAQDARAAGLRFSPIFKQYEKKNKERAEQAKQTTATAVEMATVVLR